MYVVVLINESWIRSLGKERCEEKESSKVSLAGLKKKNSLERKNSNRKDWNIALIEKNAKLMFILE